MKYASPDYQEYLVDEAERRRWWSPEGEKAEQQAERRRRLEEIALKRGMRPVYVYSIISLVWLIVFIGYTLAGGNILISIFYFCGFAGWGLLAVSSYLTLKKLKAGTGAANASGA